MLKDNWKRIAGIHVMENGDVAGVWMAIDPDADTVHVYDTCMFRDDDKNPIIVADGINCRGRSIPVAYNDKDRAEAYEKRGCNMLPDPCKDKPSEMEVVSSEISARMKTGRFRVDTRLTDWKEEYASYFREDAKVPKNSHPLMSATRHAIEMLEWARAPRSYKSSKKTYPELVIV